MVRFLRDFPTALITKAPIYTMVKFHTFNAVLEDPRFLDSGIRLASYEEYMISNLLFFKTFGRILTPEIFLFHIFS